jgi:hypothetical protein
MADFMNVLKTRQAKEVDLTQVHVKHVIDFEKKEETKPEPKPVVAQPATAQKISLSKKIEYPG